MDPRKCEEIGHLRPQLVDYAMLRLRNRAQAEDAVQETLLAALEGMDRFAGQSSLRTWLMAILKHKIVDCMRAGGREQPLEGVELPLPGSDPEEALARRRILESVDGGLGRLSGNAARVFVAREVLGMEVPEVCRELAISSANCWVLLHRARLSLRRSLAAHAV